MDSLLELFIELVIVLVICGVMLWIVQRIPMLAPFLWVAEVLIGLFLLVFLVHLLEGSGVLHLR
jgi:hypothetical protein